MTVAAGRIILSPLLVWRRSAAQSILLRSLLSVGLALVLCLSTQRFNSVPWIGLLSGSSAALTCAFLTLQTGRLPPWCCWAPAPWRPWWPSWWPWFPSAGGRRGSTTAPWPSSSSPQVRLFSAVTPPLQHTLRFWKMEGYARYKEKKPFSTNLSMQADFVLVCKQKGVEGKKELSEASSWAHSFCGVSLGEQPAHGPRKSSRRICRLASKVRSLTGKKSHRLLTQSWLIIPVHATRVDIWLKPNFYTV